MANLIITVISIALVAVAALMGAYYGGSAFMEGQRKANANKFVQDAQQIDAAITLWKVSNGNPTQLPDNEFNFLVTLKYLSSLPISSHSIANPNESYYCSDYGDASTSGGGCGYDNSAHYIVSPILIDDDPGQPPKICKMISKVSRGPSSQPINSSGDLSLTYLDHMLDYSAIKFDCIFDDGSYRLFYKIS